MAKSRKTASSSKPASPKPVRRLKKAAPPVAAPLIDTNLAAQTAAKILAARAKLGNDALASTEPAHESGTFKQLKESLQRPAAHAVSSAMGTSFGQQKSNLPIPGQKQVAHSQTQGIARVNVPRRTAG